MVHVSDFDFELPEELIAQAPAEPRDASRLLVYHRASRAVEHTVFRRLPKFLAAGDLLVLNNTQVLPHRLLGKLPTGGRVEVLILERRGELAMGYVKPARKLRVGVAVALEGGRLQLLPVAPGAEPGMFEFRLVSPTREDPGEVLAAVGRAPLPPYIRRPDAEDGQRRQDLGDYQTIYAEVPGAVAAPTAGLHFTPAVFDALAAAGVERTTVTLHVGAGTFAPIRVDEVAAHQMHHEHYELAEAASQAVGAARQRGARVVAVGTTAARVLESCAVADRLVQTGAGSTDLFLYPGRPLQVVDALLTNFHLPKSTLLMLVAAFIGREEMLRVYREAVAERYRFFSFGDAMLLV